MKFAHLVKSFRFFFPCVAYGMASFPFALPVALLVLLSDSNSVCKSLLPANSKRFHLVITHMPETSFLWMYFAFTASLNVLTFFSFVFFSLSFFITESENYLIQTDQLSLHVCEVCTITSISHDYVRLGILAHLRNTVISLKGKINEDGWAYPVYYPLGLLFVVLCRQMGVRAMFYC